MIEMNSAVSAFDGKPFVIFRWGEESGQLTPEEARMHALHVLECADAAISDAALNAWAREKMDATPVMAAQIVQDLRNFRIDMKEKDSE